MDYSYEDLAGMIDHSLLNPALRAEDLERGIQLALDYGVASVCILPYYLKRCAERLRGSSVKASTTVGFPTAATPPRSSWLKPGRPWPTAAKSSTWSRTSARC